MLNKAQKFKHCFNKFEFGVGLVSLLLMGTKAHFVGATAAFIYAQKQRNQLT